MRRIYILTATIIALGALAVLAVRVAGSPTDSGETTTPHRPIDRPSTGDERVYEKPSDETLRSRLTPIQYRVTQEDGTERPFQNEYWDNKREGIYVDVVSGEPLFSSNEKYESGTGWPSFWAPIEPDHIVEKVDRKLFVARTEVRSKHGDSHLGHVFEDGPQPTGLRYCMNSASLRFIPVEELEAEGYGEYRKLFGEETSGAAD